MTSLRDDVQRELRSLAELGLLRHPPELLSAAGPVVRLGDRDLICLCSNNYLGLANAPQLVRAIEDAVSTTGTGATASRLITGNLPAHRQAELSIAQFLGTESAVLFSSGYAANVGTLQALLSREDVVFSDAQNHASIIDGCRLSRARIHVFPHRDVVALERLLEGHRKEGRRALVVSDALFSMDGDLAPVVELRALCDRHGAALMLDEAHSIGTLGPEGRGLAAASGVEPDVLVGTLGKALGLAGAFVASSTPVADLIINRARSFVFSTGPFPALAAAVPTALELCRRADPQRVRLLDLARRLREELRTLGYHVPDGGTPVIPVLIGDPGRTMALSRRLSDHGVFAHGIRPPTVPRGTSRLRVVPIATHTDAQIDLAIAAFRAVAQTQP